MTIEATTVTRIGHTKLGDYYGRKRVYLENRTVADMGFVPGTRFSVRADEAQQTLTILLDENGPRLVSKRDRLSGSIPVIDVRSDVFDGIAAEAERARIEYGAGKIVVRLHADHAKAIERRERTRARIASGDPLRIVSLCTGLGVLDHAFTSGLAIAKVAAAVSPAVEIDEHILEHAATVSDRFAPNATLILGRLQDLDIEVVPQAEIVIAGLPCTGAALAGRAARHGMDPEDHPDAGVLFLHFLDVIRRAQPGIVILENVPTYASTAGATAIRAALDL